MVPKPAARRRAIHLPDSLKSLVAFVELSDLRIGDLRYSIPAGGLAHVDSHQSRDQNRQIKLSGDTFGDRRVARLESKRKYIAKSKCRKRGQTEVEQNRENLLLGRRSRIHTVETAEAKSVRLYIINHDVEDSPRKSDQQINRYRPADGFLR